MAGGCREGVEGMEGLHASNGAGNHGDSIGGHERNIVGRPPQCQCVVGWACGA